jgi:hypothetical protein
MHYIAEVALVNKHLNVELELFKVKISLKSALANSQDHITGSSVTVEQHALSLMKMKFV